MKAWREIICKRACWMRRELVFDSNRRQIEQLVRVINSSAVFNVQSQMPSLCLLKSGNKLLILINPSASRAFGDDNFKNPFSAHPKTTLSSKS
jgi:hypothetical protein